MHEFKLGYARKVYNVTQEILYRSVSEAAEALNLTRRSIQLACNKTQRHAAGNILEWYDPETHGHKPVIYNQIGE